MKLQELEQNFNIFDINNEDNKFKLIQSRLNACDLWISVHG